MKPLNEVGCPEMILLFIPVIIYGIYINWKAKKREQRRQEEVKKQNRNRERSQSSHSNNRQRISIPIPVEDMPKVENIAPNPRDTTWFVCTHKDLPAPSVTETEIITALDKYSIKWVREVSFKGLQFTTYSYPRFDFYLPDYNIIIEYDGQYAHSTKQQLATDKAKDIFCKSNNIRVIRYNRKHYYNLQSHICSLMKELKVKKRN